MPVAVLRWSLFIALVWVPSFTCATALAQRPAQAATPAENPAALLARAKEVMRFARVGQSVIHYRAVAAAVQNYQSDRTYPPFFSAMEVEESWFDPRTGVERVSTQTTFPGGGPSPAQIMVTDASRAFRSSNDHLNILPATSIRTRWLNPWAVVCDWAAASDVRFAGREPYRDYERIVLVRTTPSGEQRLFLDPKSGYPVKLDLTEKHYLWGQRHIEYLYANWTLAADVMIPGSSFRLADGQIEISQTTGDVEIGAQPATSSLPLPEEPAHAPDTLPLFLQPIDPRTTQIGTNTYLLTNPGYTEAVTRIGDEVFLFDATQGEERAKKDAQVIAQLFPGYKHLTLVVTDLAWPHVAGVRYWVANGATIIAHQAAKEFLQSVVDRRWTLAPDLLEQRRTTARLRFVGVNATYKLGGGTISLHPIDGIGSEVALMAYLAQDRVLWASDYIQTVEQPTSYATEVWRAAQRDGLHPERTAAEHLPLTPWTKIEELQKNER
ncbi:MAG TPA: hypothetical protein VKR57_00075 [Terriglobales bacterium]|nr:hypothetical protein [Terriglobales bacterium]